MAAFQLSFMALAISVIDRRDSSNKMHCQLQLKKSKEGCIKQQKTFYPLSLLTRRSAQVIKVGESYVWKMAKCVNGYSQRRLS